MEENEARSTPASVQARWTELEQNRALIRERDQELRSAREAANSLLEEIEALRQENAALSARWDEAQRSLGWQLVRQGGKIRAALLREGTLRGRCWSLSSRFIKTAGRSGIRAAVRKALNKITGKLARRGRGDKKSTTAFLSRLMPITDPVDRFEQLPWRFLGEDRRGPSGKSGYFKILLVSHSACRTGAPLCLLRLAEELALLADVEFWIVLQHGGELADSFARTAPTLDVETLVAQGMQRHEIPSLIAASFHEFSSRGVAICNTLAVSDFHAALAERQVSVLSWIHELPTFIESLGGKDAIERIKAASRKIMVPAEAVRNALITRFGIEPDRIRPIYNGQDARTRGLPRETMRVRVREELGLPEDAQIVLGCGTVHPRKGADLFVNVARMVFADPLAASFSQRTYFIWVGHTNNDDYRRWLFHDTGIGDLKNKIRFIGPRPDTAPYFLAADLFALTSREDPCPLVNFEAMESGLAVVAFQGAGGAPEVLRDGGVCVPYIDVAAMARAVCELLANPARRNDMGRRGQTLIRDQFTWARFMDEVLDTLKQDFHYSPSKRLKVSVIVPNYRHARYLEERLRSIFDQTLRPHEIIFLDDASPDESLEVARGLAALAPVPIKIVVNEQNSGSTFRQWLKGLSLATGDLIWIAESDDSAHPLFLERLVPEFYDPDVTLTYCQSAIVGPDGEKLADNFLGHTDDISPTRWRSRYSVSGFEEAELALSQKNTIPNASAVVFRRPAHLDFADELATLRFAGDWFFYAMLIRTGKIAYLPEVLNFYRRHQETVTHLSVRQDTQPQESLYVKARVFETFAVSANAMAGSLARTVLEYNQLSERMVLNRPVLTANQHLAGPLDRIHRAFERCRRAPSGRRILVVVGDMEAGDETLANIQLANTLAEEHCVFLCNARPSRCDQTMVASVDHGVILFEGTLGETAWSAAGEVWSQQDRLSAGPRVEILNELIRLHRIDVIHSRDNWADLLVAPVAAIEPPSVLSFPRPEGSSEYLTDDTIRTEPRGNGLRAAPRSA